MFWILLEAPYSTVLTEDFLDQQPPGRSYEDSGPDWPDCVGEAEALWLGTSTWSTHRCPEPFVRTWNRAELDREAAIELALPTQAVVYVDGVRVQ